MVLGAEVPKKRRPEPPLCARDVIIREGDLISLEAADWKASRKRTEEGVLGEQLRTIVVEALLHPLPRDCAAAAAIVGAASSRAEEPLGKRRRSGSVRRCERVRGAAVGGAPFGGRLGVLIEPEERDPLAAEDLEPSLALRRHLIRTKRLLISI